MKINELTAFLYKASQAGYATGNYKDWVKEKDGSMTISSLLHPYFPLTATISRLPYPLTHDFSTNFFPKIQFSLNGKKIYKEDFWKNSFLKSTYRHLIFQLHF